MQATILAGCLLRARLALAMVVDVKARVLIARDFQSELVDGTSPVSSNDDELPTTRSDEACM